MALRSLPSVRRRRARRPGRLAGALVIIPVAGICLLAWGAPVGARRRGAAAPSPVTFTKGSLTVPTYLAGAPERNPAFYFGRAYQGARGPVYPYPLFDTLTGNKVDKTYTALYLENEYVRFCVLPELGGRLFEAVDKTDGYHFFYRQHVIKPALIGQLGAWISGGVEWNVPHHHRATSFLPVDWAFSEGPGGAKTIWIGETELRHRMRWSVGLTLRPASSALEVSTRIFNGTPIAHSFLCWANAAVHANADYQIIFPPDTRLAAFHGKNEYSHWPVSREVYNGVDYRRGVDVSWWKNHPSPTSFFAYDGQGDFLAGYDHGREAGVVFVGDHTLVPGKKLWTWGTGSDGALWEKILTDRDGPYLELMFGSFSDNQPDYGWIKPYELKTVTQTWYPIRGIGGVEAANARAACRLELEVGPRAAVGVLTTEPQPAAVVRLTLADKVVFEDIRDIGPDRPFTAEVALPGDVRPEWLRLSLSSARGEELIGYRPCPRSEPPLPEPVAPPPAPDTIVSNEELWLAGLRLEQFHNPALDPEPYYLEVLERDPDDARANTALGRREILAGRFEEAARRLRRAVRRLSANETRPKDTEPLFYLGAALRNLGRGAEAEEVFGRAAWDSAWSAAAWFEMAGIAAADGAWERALDLAGRSLAADGQNPKAACFKTSLLRRTGRKEEAAALAGEVLSRDPLDLWAANELRLLSASGERPGQVPASKSALRDRPGDTTQNHLELAADYAHCGLVEEAAEVLLGFAAGREGQGVDPMVHYDLAYYLHKSGREADSLTHLKKAGSQSSDLCFPFQLESIAVLAWAAEAAPRDALPPYLLGNLLFDRQPGPAIAAWERARSLDACPPMADRNLGIAYSRIKNDLPRAVAGLEKAVGRDPDNAKLYAELDELYDLAGTPPGKRLAVLERRHETVARRGDSLSREIALLIDLGRYDRAIELLLGHRFHVWEGGEGVHDLYVDAHLLRGQRALVAGRPGPALADFRKALDYPENLEVARPAQGGREPEVEYWIGAALEAMGRTEEARSAFRRSASAGAPADEPLYYQGLSWRRLGDARRAAAAFDALLDRARAGLETRPDPDFFGKFGEKESAVRSEAGLRYLMGLALLGRDRPADARSEFERALALYPGHSRAGRALAGITGRPGAG